MVGARVPGTEQISQLMPCEVGKGWLGGRGGCKGFGCGGVGGRGTGRRDGANFGKAGWVTTRAGLVDGGSGRRGKGSAGGGCKGFGPGGAGGRDTGPQGRSKFRNVCPFFFVTRTKRRKMAFFEGCPVGWGGYPPELAWWTGG